MAHHQQLVENKNLSNLAGIGLIVGLLAFLYCLATILNALQRRFGLSYDIATVLLWGIGAAVALTMMHDRVLSYRYTLSGSTLRLDRFYGRYMRHARDIMFRKIENVGDVDAMKFGSTTSSPARRAWIPIGTLTLQSWRTCRFRSTAICTTRTAPSNLTGGFAHENRLYRLLSG